MKILAFLLFFPLLCLATIYDQDDRYEAFEIFDHLDFYLSNKEQVTSLDSDMVEHAINATAAMILPRYLKTLSGGEVQITGTKVAKFRFYSTKKYLCEDVRFIEQDSAATCSGSLIGPQHILTAGHCVVNMNSCHNYKWVFNYKYQSGYGDILVNEDDIFNCVEILGRHKDGGRNVDWAIIKLDREVFGRRPLKTRNRTFMKYQDNGVEKKSKIDSKVPLFLVGFPFGTPMKVTTNGLIAKTGLAHAFQASIDNFFGNSGGPVINAKTGIVEGVVAHLGLGAWGLVDGGIDRRGEKSCLVPKKINTAKAFATSNYLQVSKTHEQDIIDILRKEGIQ